MPKVLIADDSIAVRKVAERLLTEAGFGVTLAANGEEALAYLAKEKPDLIVSDVIMPDKSGYEVCAFVRAQRGIATTPVLLISGIVNDEVTKQAESCHADGVLKKPFQGTSLKDRVLELLAKRQGAAMPAAKSIEKTIEPVQPIQSSRVSEEQVEVYRRAMARLKPLEEELLAERDRATQSARRVAELEGQLGRVKELESMLTQEREQTAQLRMQLAAADSATARVHELETALASERARCAEMKDKVSSVESLGGRVRELEMTLQAERQAATQLVEQMTEMEQALSAEKEKTKDLAARIVEAERPGQKAQEFEALLQTERERNSLLARRVAETEQASEEATKRFEEMAKKLGEIAGLASQLGSGKRRL